MSSSFHNWLEPKILSGIITASLALWIFVEIAENVIDGDIRYFDTAILIAKQWDRLPLPEMAAKCQTGVSTQPVFERRSSS